MARNSDATEQEQGTKGLQMDPGFEAKGFKDALDCAASKDDDGKELWLLQIPPEFPLDEKVVWQAVQPGSHQVNATCQIEEAGYKFVEEQEVGTAPVYAVGGEELRPVRVARRVSVVRQTDAPKICFGIDEAVQEEEDRADAAMAAAAVARAAAAAVPSAPAAEGKERKGKKDKKGKKRGGGEVGQGKKRGGGEVGQEAGPKKKKSKKK